MKHRYIELGAVRPDDPVCSQVMIGKMETSHLPHLLRITIPDDLVLFKQNGYYKTKDTRPIRSLHPVHMVRDTNGTWKIIQYRYILAYDARSDRPVQKYTLHETVSPFSMDAIRIHMPKDMLPYEWDDGKQITTQDTRLISQLHPVPMIRFSNGLLRNGPKELIHISIHNWKRYMETTYHYIRTQNGYKEQ